VNKCEIRRETLSSENGAAPIDGVKKPYDPPILTEYGSMAQLTKGTGSGVVDLLSQQLTLNVTILFPPVAPRSN
jgi:hypothetical protein